MKVRVASAGTGKTTSLVLRYLELIASGTPVRRIAGVTFTRAAADELRQRVAGGIRDLLQNGAYLHVPLNPAHKPALQEALRELDGATLSTIHGFMIQSLRIVAPLMGIDPHFSVLGEWEAQAIFEEEVNSLLYLASDPAHGLHDACAHLGSDAQTLLLTLFTQRSLTERYQADSDRLSQSLQRVFDAAYKRYEVRLGATLLPPSEVERRALKLVRHPAALKRLTHRYHTVLVDEFQDVNPLQGHFFEKLESAGMQVEVVGDPKQSIYGFRNADVGVFRRALAAGERLEDLTQTRRHALVIARFLNHMTRSLAERNMGYSVAEAPDVTTTGAQEATQGRVELHWLTGDEGIAKLRQQEAAILAKRLKLLHEQRGYAYKDMAVLARSYAGLKHVEQALQAHGLPYVLLQGRGYYERIEIRDLYHALRVALNPSGLSLGSWLRSPFAQLLPADISRIMNADDPLAVLEADYPDVWQRLERMTLQVRGNPQSTLKFLIREPFISGRRYVDYLDSRARENVDALLFTVAAQPPGDTELLLERLDLLSKQSDAGDVPQSGEGVQLLTVHKSKGLEWPVVAVFDLGRDLYHPPQALYVHPASGMICCQGSDRFEDARQRIKERDEEESYRLLYVACSRPRDVLLLTGSMKKKPAGWMKALHVMGVGADVKPYDRAEFMLQTYQYDGSSLPEITRQRAEGLQAASYIDRVFKHHPGPPVSSPSQRKQQVHAQGAATVPVVMPAAPETPELIHEPLPFSDPDEGERLPGRATTVGTLTHFAISQNWQANNPVHLSNLKAQEVMFPFTPEEQADILAEVKTLLANYEALLGHGIPALRERSHDFPELPMALPYGASVWQGIIDRLYCAHGEWYLEDYKTDQTIKPEQYYFQLAVYLKAIQDVKNINPHVQLVYLRESKIVRIDPAHLADITLT